MRGSGICCNERRLENQTAKSHGAMTSYSFDWMWTELGIAELRR